MNKTCNGTTDNRPSTGVYKGFEYYNTDLKSMQFYDGNSETPWLNYFTQKNVVNTFNITEPGIYPFYSETVEQPGEGKGYGNTLIVFKSSMPNMAGVIQIFYSGKDNQTYIRCGGPNTVINQPWQLMFSKYTPYGTSDQRPYNTGTYKKLIGFSFFDTTLNIPIYWDGTKWVSHDGISADILRVNSTINRPLGSAIHVGFQYFDITIGKPIWARAISGDTVTWVDATGATV